MTSAERQTSGSAAPSAGTDELGRAAHEAWKRWRIEHGYSGHAFVGQWINYAGRDDCYWGCAVCGKRLDDHYDDMVPWDDLPVEKREKYQRMAEAGAAAERARYSSAVMALVEAWEALTGDDGKPECWTEEMDWRITALHKLALVGGHP